VIRRLSSTILIGICIACDGVGVPISDATQISGSAGSMNQPIPTVNEGSGGAPGGIGGQGGTGSGGHVPIWSEPKLLSVNDPEAGEQDPAMSFDGTELYFTSTRSGGAGRQDIWKATRASLMEEWGQPTLATALSTELHEFTPELSSDALHIWICRTQDGSISLFESSRPDRQTAWSVPSLVSGLGGNPIGLSPAVSSDGLTLLFSRSNSDLNFDILRATRASLGENFGEPAPVAEINTIEDDWDPSLSSDGTIYYSRSGDIFSRPRNLDGTYGQETPVWDVNTPEFEFDPWISADGKILLFASRRSGNEEIYEVHRD